MSLYIPDSPTIKYWAEEDRPREKLVLKGVQALSNAELIAILLGSGSKEQTAVGLARHILQDVGNNINDLGKLSLAALMKFKGVGQAKAVSIMAAIELGRRRQSEDINKREHLATTQDAVDLFASHLGDLVHEEFWVVYVNRANRILAKKQLSIGGIAATIVDVRLILREALALAATGMIVYHNHPSGRTKPSETDNKLTKKLLRAGEAVDVKLLDHIIIAGKTFYSYSEDRKL